MEKGDVASSQFFIDSSSCASKMKMSSECLLRPKFSTFKLSNPKHKQSFSSCGLAGLGTTVSCNHLICTVCFIITCFTISVNAQMTSSNATVAPIHLADTELVQIESSINPKFNLSNEYDDLMQTEYSQKYDSELFSDNLETEKVILKLFTKYQDENFLTIDNLDKLFQRVKYNAEIAAHSHSKSSLDHIPDNDHLRAHDNDNHSYELNNDATSRNLAADGNQELPPSDFAKINYPQNLLMKGGDVKKTQNDLEHCLFLEELLQIFQFNALQSLGPQQFLHLCPVLIDQLDSGYCKTSDIHLGARKQELNEDDHHHHHNINSNQTTDPIQIQAPFKAWCFTFLSIVIISVCCVVGAIVIPNMEKVFYNHILQFLVALAVGAMSSDAMLHLLPHALLSESHHADHHHKHHGDAKHHNDSSNVDWKSGHTPSHMAALYKGLVALLGMYGFFFLERFFTHFTKHRSMKKKKKSKSWISCVDETNKPSMLSSTLEAENSNIASCDAVVMVVHPNKALKAYADVRHEALLHSCDESLILSPSGCDIDTRSGANGSKACVIGSASEAVISRDSQSAGHGDAVLCCGNEAASRPCATRQDDHCHSHRRGHLIDALSSVAMMIIVGDIIHSFCAGLAIGTAYAGNSVGGLSTSVAVFCYALPHEIGDLAVLMRSGLTLKKAVYFNLLSTLPSFFGAMIGLIIGNVGSASVWIFAGAGGMFLYVTLVDLVPEMTSVYTKSGEPWFLHLLLQAIGISVGATIMLIISISEESLLTQYYTAG